jgi:arylsulfatase A-like enzyme
MFLLRLIYILILLFFISCNSSNLIEKPNVVLFMVDDLGWQDTSVSFWNNETKFNKLYNTPNMERLAEMGVKFTNAYATPVCSPSRISLMTGMNAAKHRVTNWTLHPNKKKPAEINHKTFEFPDWNYNGLSISDSVSNSVYATPLPQILNDNGYYTIHAGKAHLGAIGYPSSDPLNIGFDINIAGHAAGAPQSYLGTDNFGNNDQKNKIWAVPGLEKYHGKNIFLTQAITEEVLIKIQNPIKSKSPFFLYFSLYGVHAPLMEDNRFVEKYKNIGIENSEIKYASMIESMDYALGIVLDELKKKDILKNTIIVFMSDNGGLSAVARGGQKHQHNYPLKSGKGSIYEGGIRVPMIVYSPFHKTNVKEIDQPVIIEDFFPSILELTNSKKSSIVQEIDGQSFVPLLNNEEIENKPLFWHYPNWWGPNGPGIGSYSAVRQEEWKFIYFHDTQTIELYNLETDISENNNLISVNYLKSEHLANVLTNYLISVDAQMPFNKKSKSIVPWPNQLPLFN